MDNNGQKIMLVQYLSDGHPLRNGRYLYTFVRSSRNNGEFKYSHYPFKIDKCRIPAIRLEDGH